MKSIAIAFATIVFAATTAWGQSDIKTKTDVVYATHDGVDLKGDLYQPASGAQHPALIFIHGGGFRGGSKSGYQVSWGPYLAARGYVAFAIDYRLSSPTQSSWPQALLDCKAAIQYLRGDAAELGIDPERIGVAGDSAGGALTAMLGVTQDWPVFANKYPKDTYASASTKVKVIVPVYGVFDMMACRKSTRRLPRHRTTPTSPRSICCLAARPTLCRDYFLRVPPSTIFDRRRKAWAK